MLAFAAVLIPAGRLGDLVGRRPLFLIGVASFGTMSLLCGLSATPTELIVCRVIQGTSAAFLIASLTLLAFSVGAIITAPQAGTLALRHGRRVLMLGALLMALGTVGAALPAWISPAAINSWIIGPGLIVSGGGLGFLVVPLVNVVLAAVPSGQAGGASGVFSTAQQLGGAIGVAILGTVFFGHLGVGHFDAAFQAAVPIAIVSLLVCLLLCFLLPDAAVTEEAVAELG